MILLPLLLLLLVLLLLSLQAKERKCGLPLAEQTSAIENEGVGNIN